MDFAGQEMHSDHPAPRPPALDLSAPNCLITLRINQAGQFSWQVWLAPSGPPPRGNPLPNKEPSGRRFRAHLRPWGWAAVRLRGPLPGQEKGEKKGGGPLFGRSFPPGGGGQLFGLNDHTNPSLMLESAGGGGCCTLSASRREQFHFKTKRTVITCSGYFKDDHELIGWIKSNQIYFYSQNNTRHVF